MNNLISLLQVKGQPFFRAFGRYDLVILMVVASLISAYLWLSPVRVHSLTLEDSQYHSKGEFEINNSYRPKGNGNPKRRLLHRAKFEYNALSQDTLHIRTLDCEEYILLNGKSLRPKLLSGNLCNDYSGAYFDISELAVPGTNTLEIKTRHTRSKHIVFFGFDVSSANLASPLYLGLVCLLVCILFYGVFTRLVRSPLPAYALGILLLGILVRVFVVSNTHALERSHDVYGHIEYMDILIDTKALPKSEKCWSCYHPPYYFGTMASAKALLTKAGLSEFNVYQAIMLGSVATYSICLYFAFLTIARFFSRPSLQLFSMGLFAFLPSSVMHSVAINNDLWMFTLFTIAFYYFVRWWQSKRTRYYYISLGFAALSVIVKANGIVMFGLLGVFALGFALSRYRQFFTMVKRFTPAVAIMGLALAFNPIVDKTFRPPSDKPSGGIISNAGGLSTGLIIENEVRNYIRFDLAGFVDKPFVHPLDDESGRQYFWTTLLKTALYGEFRDHHAHNEGSVFRNAIAPAISATFLILLLFVILHALLARKQVLVRYGQLYALLATCLLALLFIRILLPFFPMNDFRYIWTILLAPCVLVPLAVDTCRQRDLPILAGIGYGAMSVSITLSVLFCLSM